MPADAPNREREDAVRLLGRIAPLFALAFAAAWLITLDLRAVIPRDGTGLVIGRDFLNFWMAGRAAWGSEPERFYEIATYQSQLAPIVGVDYPGQVWSYPPTVMLAAAPFGLLPYLPALLLWSLIGPVVLLAALRRLAADRRLLVPILLSPAAMFAMMSGQLALLAAAAILGALHLRRDRPWLAGALLGVLTIKPQLGLLFPILLLSERNWKVLGTATLCALLVAAATAAIWGIDVWTAYFELGIPTQSRVLSDPQAIAGPFMPTIFMNLRSAGATSSLAAAAQAVGTVIAIALVAWRFSRRPEPGDWRANSLFLAASVFGTGYLLSYDTLALSAAVLFAALEGRTGRLLTLAVWLLTLLQLIFGSAGLPGPALVPILLAGYLAKQAASSTWVDQRNCPTGRTQGSE